MKLKKEELKKIIKEVVEQALAEVSPEDINMIFNQMIKDAATTHQKLNPAQQEAYENLLVQTGRALASGREEQEREI
tara:strand:- start:5189 stop:5419 length:231 start_codon:yes stop_codon:yes gene_type:complete